MMTILKKTIIIMQGLCLKSIGGYWLKWIWIILQKKPEEIKQNRNHLVWTAGLSADSGWGVATGVPVNQPKNIQLNLRPGIGR